jgi:hypothetical protein
VLLYPATPAPTAPRPPRHRVPGPAGPGHGPASRAAQQLRGALDRVADVEQAAGQRLDPDWRPPLVMSEPVRQRPLAQPGFQPGPLPRTQLLPGHRSPRPQRFRAAIPPGPVPPPDQPPGNRKSCAISLILSPRANCSAACSRTCSRRRCPPGMYPPRCAYRIPGHTPAASRRHDPNCTSSVWLSLITRDWRTWAQQVHLSAANCSESAGPSVGQLSLSRGP